MRDRQTATERKTERERDRQTDRQTERQRQRQRQRQTNRQTRQSGGKGEGGRASETKAKGSRQEVRGHERSEAGR